MATLTLESVPVSTGTFGIIILGQEKVLGEQAATVAHRTPTETLSTFLKLRPTGAEVSCGLMMQG